MPAKKQDLPGTLQRSPAKAQRTYEKTLDRRTRNTTAKTRLTAPPMRRSSTRSRRSAITGPKYHKVPSDEQAKGRRGTSRPTTGGVERRRAHQEGLYSSEEARRQRPEQHDRGEWPRRSPANGSAIPEISPCRRVPSPAASMRGVGERWCSADRVPDATPAWKIAKREHADPASSARPDAVGAANRADDASDTRPHRRAAARTPLARTGCRIGVVAAPRPSPCAVPSASSARPRRSPRSGRVVRTGPISSAGAASSASPDAAAADDATKANGISARPSCHAGTAVLLTSAAV